MRIALAQINALIGDFEGNKAKILDYVRRSSERRCDLVVFPEAALFGYHPVDLLERPSIVAEQEKHLKDIHKKLPKGMGVLLGAIMRNTSGQGKGFWNAAVFLQKGSKPHVFPKQLLPTYDVFDESRHIEPGCVAKNILKWKGRRILVTVCEDIWGWKRKDNPFFSTYGRNPLEDVKASSVDLILNLSASPFTHTKWKNRRLVAGNCVKRFKCPMVYVNMVGAQDELIFDGGSFALDARGKVIAQSLRFDEDLNYVDVDVKKPAGGIRNLPDDDQEIVRNALVLGLRDFVRKTGFQKVHLGLSGGIDSALVAALAADAVGPMNVTGIMLPGPFTSVDSTKWSKELAASLAINLCEVQITPSYKQVLSDFEKEFGAQDFNVVNENLQARLRGIMLMAYSNRERSLLLATSNKSELAVGYSTIYGDMCGGLMPIGDLLKTEVFALSRYYNADGDVIPAGIIDRPPSAELRANQKDQDTLPPYDVLDRIISKLVVGFHAPSTDLEKKILDMMMKSEFKRWQSPPVLKVSDHAFGRGRRFPVAHIAKG
jgi:NAD+ synthase (glutamine-hydrolysing)